MKHRLYIVEGLPCSGKSSVSAFIAHLLAEKGKVCFVDEGTGEHPADYEFHALSPKENRIVSLADVAGDARERLMPFKIYDGLPWEIEKPLMLDKWRSFAAGAQPDTAYVFNCVLLQNPMCETMMRFGFDEAQSLAYIRQIAQIIRPLDPAVVYLQNSDIASSIRKAAPERPGWLDAVIDYHTSGAYGKGIGAQGFEGYIRCLRERQERELRILAQLPVRSVVVDDPQRDWPGALERIRIALDA